MTEEQTEGAVDEPTAAESVETTETEPGAPAPSTDHDGSQEAGDDDSSSEGTGDTPDPVEHDYSGIRAGEGVSAETIESVVTFAREAGLEPDVAQKILDREAEATKAVTDSLVTSFEAERSQWKDALKADPELGGDNLPITRQRLETVLRDFDPDGKLRSLLDEYGYIDHPAMVGLLARVGQALEPGKVAPGGPSAPAQKTPEEVMYPDD